MSQKGLLIAEKPDLTRKIEAAYNAHKSEIPYEITFVSMRGHLVTLKEPEELDESLKTWSWDTLPIIPSQYGGWQYKVIQEKRTGSYLTSQERYDNIKKEIESNSYDFVIHAGDPDKEGELLVWLVLKKIGNTLPVKRFWTNDVTEKAIVDALKHLRDDEHDAMLVNLLKSAYVRQHEDWGFGMNISRASSLKMNGRVATGRVKTAIQAIVCKREIEIKNFKPSTCYGIKSEYSEKFSGMLFEPVEKGDEDTEEETNSGTIYFENKEDAQKLMSSLGNKATVVSYESKEIRTAAPKLFKLSTVQIAAGKLGYSSSETLDIIQSLYEKTFLSYPRTDCEYISSTEDLVAALNSCKSIPELVPFIDKIDKNAILEVQHTKKWVNDAKLKESGHSALKPTANKPDFNTLSQSEQDIYRLICRQFVAIFLPPLVQKKQLLICDVDGHLFKSNGKSLVSAGYTELLGTKFNDNIIPEHSKGEVIDIDQFAIIEKTTVCPKRFTDPDLIAVCENPLKYLDDDRLKSLGKNLTIGTPATRSGIIKTLIEKDKYLKKQKDKKNEYIVPTDIGMAIYLNLKDCRICKVDMTAEMEERLKMIESGELSASEVEKTIEHEIINMVNEIKNSEMKQFQRKTYPAICKCPICEGDIISGPKGFFCSAYKSGCKAGGFKKICDSILSDEEIKDLMEGKEIKKILKKDKLKWEQKLQYNRETLKIEFVKEEMIGSQYHCPSCGKVLLEDSQSLICECGAKFWKIAGGKHFTEEQIKNLFENGSTGIVKGITSKSGKKFDAEFVFNNEKKGITFQFPRPTISAYNCPKCGENMEESGKLIKCSCGFSFWKTVCGKDLSQEQINNFFHKGSTGIIKGLKNKKGKKFNAEIVLNEQKDGTEFKFA